MYLSETATEEIKDLPAKKPSHNPLGRPKRELSTSAKTKDDLFKAFQQAGGLQRVVRLIEAKKLGKTKESRSKAAQADKLFLELAFNVLPRMVPKETTLDVETRSVVFQFTNMAQEEIKARIDKGGDAIDIEFTKEP